MRSLPLSRQLTVLITAFIVTSSAAVGGLAWELPRIAATARRMAAEGNRRTDALFTLVAAVGKVQEAAQRLVRERDPDNIEKLLDTKQGLGNEALKTIRDAGDGAEDVASAFQALQNANERATQQALLANYAQAQQILIEESNPAFDSLLRAVGKLQQATSNYESGIEAQAEARGSRAQTLILILSAAAMAGLFAASILLLRSMNHRLRRAARELAATSGDTAESASRLHSSSRDLAERASGQAASLEETASAALEISVMTRQNTANSKAAADTMNQAVAQVNDANTRLQQMVASMDEINSSSQKVSRIIRTIDEIAFQTNILALNAAVEAARAGAAGAGFGVVADEVRSLARRCAQAAQETSELIEESAIKSSEGKKRLEQVAVAIQSITESARHAKTLVDKISRAGEEQAHGIEQVSQAIEGMKQATEIAGSHAQAGAEGGEKLSSQAASMQATVAQLQFLVDGKARV